MNTLETGHAWDFFLAHASADAASAEALYELLDDGKTRIFLDSHCVELGDDWDLKIAEAQQASLVTVVLVSSNTEQAYYQRAEIAAAIGMARDGKHRHRVVPLYLDPKARSNGFIPYGLEPKASLYVTPDEPLTNAASELHALLERLRAPGNEISTPHDLHGIFHQPPTDWVSPVRRNPFHFKVAAFDLDGTLLRGEGFEFSWEAVWRGLNFSNETQDKLKREYLKRSKANPSQAGRRQAYEDWCKNACAHFSRRGVTREQMRLLCRPLTLTHNCRKGLSKLRANGVVTAIISGGIHTLLEDMFPDFREFVDFVFINELLFAPTGTLATVRATAYDFEGKKDALELVCERAGCGLEEAVFVGDQFNDQTVMLAAGKGIAYPPSAAPTKWASAVAIDDDDLMAVVAHVLVE